MGRQRGETREQERKERQIRGEQFRETHKIKSNQVILLVCGKRKNKRLKVRSRISRCAAMGDASSRPGTTCTISGRRRGDGEVRGGFSVTTKPCSDEQHDDGNTSPCRGPDRNHIHF